MATLLFVYGTLLRGETNHGLLGPSRFVSSAVTEPAFTLYDLGEHPGLAPTGSNRVVGEIYEVDAPALVDLDRFEGHPDHFRRAPIRVKEHGDVQSYFAPAALIDGASIIESGDWRRHRARAARR